MKHTESIGFLTLVFVAWLFFKQTHVINNTYTTGVIDFYLTGFSVDINNLFSLFWGDDTVVNLI